MNQHQQNKTSNQPLTANWEHLRIAHFNREGSIINLADKEQITLDAKKYNISESLALPPAFTTMESAEDFAQRVISLYSTSNFIRPCITGFMIEEKPYNGSTLYLPFIRVLPSPHAPGQPAWKGTLKIAEALCDALGESPEELRSNDGKYDSSHNRGRIMVSTLGHFQGILFVGGNSLNIRFAPGRNWMLAHDGRMGEFNIQ